MFWIRRNSNAWRGYKTSADLHVLSEHDTDLPAGCGNIFSFQSNFCHAIIPDVLSFFDVEVKPDQKNEDFIGFQSTELHFPSIIFQLYSRAHLI